MRPTTFIVAVVFLTLLFVLGPMAAVRLNDALAWPRWETVPGSLVGAVLIAAGIGVSIYCSRLFARIGLGTPVPVQPPERLVAAGLYRYSRNPIFVADLAILLGVFLLRGELALLLYTAVVALFLQIVIVGREEPELRKRFGEDYDRYVRGVPRWIGLRAR